MAQSHPQWAIGFEDETWWSRVAQPRLSAWASAGQPLRLHEQPVAKDDPDPKALSCYGMLVRWYEEGVACQQPWLRFVSSRPQSTMTVAFLEWSCSKLCALGKEALLLIWDNASWHHSRQVRRWIGQHNRRVKEEGGVRIVCCYLPVKSPWLNPIEPYWMHGKRKVVEPARLLTAAQLRERVCAYFGCAQEDLLSIPDKVA